MELTNEQKVDNVELELELDKLQEDYLPKTTKDLTKGLSAALGLSNVLQSMATLMMKGAIALRRTSYSAITALYEKGFDGVKVSDELYAAASGHYTITRSSSNHKLAITLLSILISDYRDLLITGDFTDIFTSRTDEDMLEFVTLCFPELNQKIIISAYHQAKEVVRGNVDLEEAEVNED